MKNERVGITTRQMVPRLAAARAQGSYVSRGAAPPFLAGSGNTTEGGPPPAPSQARASTASGGLSQQHSYVEKTAMQHSFEPPRSRASRGLAGERAPSDATLRARSLVRLASARPGHRVHAQHPLRRGGTGPEDGKRCTYRA